MNEFLLSVYVLVWPVMAAAILAMLVVSVVKDHRAAKKSGRDMV